MDIDLDLKTDFDPKQLFKKTIPASMVKDGILKKHPAGYYFQDIPIDKLTGLSAIPYEEAEKIGFLKIDFLHLYLLDYFKSKKEIKELLKIEPKWEMLQEQKIVENLFQLQNSFDLLTKIKPNNVEELADCLALRIPSKRHLIEFYRQDEKLVRQELYRKPDDGSFYYKKPHALAYAFTVILNMHLIDLGIIKI